MINSTCLRHPVACIQREDFMVRLPVLLPVLMLFIKLTGLSGHSCFSEPSWRAHKTGYVRQTSCSIISSRRGIFWGHCKGFIQMWYDSDCWFVTSPIVAVYMDAMTRSHFLVSFGAMYGLYFGQGSVSRSDVGKLAGTVLFFSFLFLLIFYYGDIG